MSDALNNNLTDALRIVEQYITEKKGKKADALYEVSRARAAVRAAESVLEQREAKVAEFDKVIAGYEKQAADLRIMLGQRIPPVTGSMELLPIKPDSVEYKYAHLIDVKSTTGYGSHCLFAVLVVVNGKNERIVLKCDCEAFRFTKGELRDAKTCKHIQKFIRNNGRLTASAKARRALRSEGRLGKSEPVPFALSYR